MVHVIHCNDMFSGAVYQAAALSKAFVVKKFLIKEATIYPIEVIIHVYIHVYSCYKHDHYLTLQVLYKDEHLRTIKFSD